MSGSKKQPSPLKQFYATRVGEKFHSWKLHQSTQDGISSCTFVFLDTLFEQLSCTRNNAANIISRIMREKMRKNIKNGKPKIDLEIFSGRLEPLTLKSKKNTGKAFLAFRTNHPLAEIPDNVLQFVFGNDLTPTRETLGGIAMLTEDELTELQDAYTRSQHVATRSNPKQEKKPELPKKAKRPSDSVGSAGVAAPGGSAGVAAPDLDTSAMTIRRTVTEKPSHPASSLKRADEMGLGSSAHLPAGPFHVAAVAPHPPGRGQKRPRDSDLYSAAELLLSLKGPGF